MQFKHLCKSHPWISEVPVERSQEVLACKLFAYRESFISFGSYLCLEGESTSYPAKKLRRLCLEEMEGWWLGNSSRILSSWLKRLLGTCTQGLFSKVFNHQKWSFRATSLMQWRRYAQHQVSQWHYETRDAPCTPRCLSLEGERLQNPVSCAGGISRPPLTLPGSMLGHVSGPVLFIGCRSIFLMWLRTGTVSFSKCEDNPSHGMLKRLSTEYSNPSTRCW